MTADGSTERPGAEARPRSFAQGWRARRPGIFVHSVAFDNTEQLFGPLVADIRAFQRELLDYSERALLLARPTDLLVANGQPDKDHLAYLHSLGLGTQRVVVPQGSGPTLGKKLLDDDATLEKLREFVAATGAADLHPYIADADAARIAEAAGATLFGCAPDITRQSNSKLHLRELAKRLGLPVAEGEVAPAEQLVGTATRLLEAYGRVIVKADQSCGGAAVWLVTSSDEIDRLPIDSGPGARRTFLVERLYDIVASPNVQFLATERGAVEIGMTDQVLAPGFRHHGNSYPCLSAAREEMQRMALLLAQELHREGYRGIVGVDFIELESGRVLPVEANARANTSSFALCALADHLADRSVRLRLAYGIPAKVGLRFNDLRAWLGRDLFSFQDGGVMPYNLSCLEWGKFDAVFVGEDERHLQRLLHKVGCI